MVTGLPDSRLRESVGEVMVDWKWRDANGLPVTIRLCLQPIFCFNCGKPAGHVPKDTMAFVSWLCDGCSDRWGDAASLHSAPDQEFWDKVSEEIFKRFGRGITQAELNLLAERSELGRGLELLDRESPYRKGMDS